MSTVNETKKLLTSNKRGIREIPETIRKGVRMTKDQLRFCVIVTVVLIMALFVGMVITGNNADKAVAVNEEVQVLQDAGTAERILSVDGKKIAFEEGYSWSGNGQRLILNEKIVTSKDYYVTLSPESEIAEYEKVLGEGRFLPVETLGNNSIWIVMATEEEMKKVSAASPDAAIVPINNIPDSSWLQKGTDEENKAAEKAFSNIRFIQFEKLGTTHIRLRRGLESEIRKADDSKTQSRKLRLFTIFLLIAAVCGLAFCLKSNKVLKKPESFQKLLRTGLLIAAAVFLGLTVFLTVQMDQAQDQLTRLSAVIMPVDGETTAEDEVLLVDTLDTVASDQKFTFTDKGVVRTVSIPQTVGGTSLNRILKYALLALLGIVAVGLLYMFRYERDLGFPMFNTVILILLMMVTIYPVLNTLATSFNDGTDAVRGGIGILPRKFSMKSYDNILSKQEIFDAAWVSASKTVIITILNLFWTGMLAYTLSRREYVLRKLITTLMVLTMYVNAGLIPSYLLISQTLNLAHTYWVYIIPTMFSCFNMIVIRTYIAGLPDALVESAKIDGAGDFRIYWKIIFPLCTPVLATVALFVAVGSWNSWFDTRLYNAGQKDPKTLQYLLQMKILTAGQNANAANTSTDALKAVSKTEPITIRAAITVVSTVPILVVYPFLQKYFVTGMALGSVKG